MYQYFIPFIHQLMNIWSVSTFWRLRITLLWTFTYKFLCGVCFHLSLLGICLGMEFVGHMVAQFLIFWRTAFDIPANNLWRLKFFHILVNTTLSVFSILAIPESRRNAISETFQLRSKGIIRKTPQKQRFLEETIRKICEFLSGGKENNYEK